IIVGLMRSPEQVEPTIRRRSATQGADALVVRGAREHNLKNVDLELPREKLIVFTGLSGSGKSSLAFDTIYAEGQRRYVESLSAYARQFLGQMDKPDVDFIEGLSPAISIDQKSASRNPRSTVGTITEIYDYLRLLYARIGVPHCPKCGAVVSRQTPQQIVDRILELPQGTRFQVLAPVVRGRKGEYEGLLEELGRQGNGSERTLTFSQHLACPNDGTSFEELAPRSFSFNSPYGACNHCAGLGTRFEVDPELVVPDPELSIDDGAVAPWSGNRSEYFHRVLTAVADTYGFSAKIPWKKLKKPDQKVVLYGSGTKQIHVQYRNRYGRTRSYHTHYEGVVTYLQRRHSEAESDYVRE